MDREVGYGKGQTAWPDVPLTMRDHAAAWDMVPGAPPVHVEDFYLAAAGGFRLNRAWERIELDLGDKVRRCLSFQATADYFIEDLWADVLTAIMADVNGDLHMPTTSTGDKPAKLLLYRAKVSLIAYLVTIGKRIAISRHRKRKPDLGLPSHRDDAGELRQSAIEDPDSIDPALNASHREIDDALRRVVREAIAALSPEQRLLLAMVYTQDAKQKEAAAILGWGEPKASRHLKSAIKALGEAVSGFSDGSEDALAMAKWAMALREILETQVQEQQLVAS